MNVVATFDGSGPLSQVVFVHDYIQLVFQDLRFTIYSPVAITVAGRTLRRGDIGFCDAFVAQIGARAGDVEYLARQCLELRFTTGAQLAVSLVSEDANGPELFQLNRPGFPTIVEQVA